LFAAAVLLSSGKILVAAVQFQQTSRIPAGFR
jgi:hypothetical protein